MLLSQITKYLEKLSQSDVHLGSVNEMNSSNNIQWLLFIDSIGLGVHQFDHKYHA